jgi:hypothetical protein
MYVCAAQSYYNIHIDAGRRRFLSSSAPPLAGLVSSLMCRCVVDVSMHELFYNKYTSAAQGTAQDISNPKRPTCRKITAHVPL